MIEETLRGISALDVKWEEAAQKRLDSLTKPLGSLGRLEVLAKQMAAIRQTLTPSVGNKTVFVMAADHGVTEENVSVYPKEVTPQMVANFVEGGAAINVFSRLAGARVRVVDMGVAADLSSFVSSGKILSGKIGMGTRNFSREPAMTLEEAKKAVAFGIQLVHEECERGLDLTATGDMGIGNTTSASALTCVFTGESPREATGRGTGLDALGWQRKCDVISKALDLHKPSPKDPLRALSQVGGFEIAGIVGVILGASSRRIPVILDGFISGAAALVAHALSPASIQYCIAGHVSFEAGHKAILEHLRLAPILNLEMRLGEGTGAVLAMTLVEAAARMMTEMATFESAGVSEKLEEDVSEKLV